MSPPGKTPNACNSHSFPGGHELTNALLRWYASDYRDLPWRQTRDPYRIWVSEVMLSQTRAETVIPYYYRFLERFPTLHALAEASLDEVLRVWEGLGYYARARNLHAAARWVRDERGGMLPDSWDTWLSLPGVGAYIAGAILSIAYGQPYPAVDGNARRVLVRVFAIQKDTASSATRRDLVKRARRLIPPDHPGEFSQALMELGAVLCKPRAPRCSICPVEHLCCARAQGMQEMLPLVRPRRSTPHHIEVAGVVTRDHNILITQRAPHGLLGGLWEFPGGRAGEGEEPETALLRLLAEHWELQVCAETHLAAIEHAYTHFSITLHAFRCHHLSGHVSPSREESCRWILPDQLSSYAFSVAQRKIARMVSP